MWFACISLENTSPESVQVYHKPAYSHSLEGCHLWQYQVGPHCGTIHSGTIIVETLHTSEIRSRTTPPRTLERFIRPSVHEVIKEECTIHKLVLESNLTDLPEQLQVLCVDGVASNHDTATQFPRVHVTADEVRVSSLPNPLRQ